MRGFARHNDAEISATFALTRERTISQRWLIHKAEALTFDGFAHQRVGRNRADFLIGIHQYLPADFFRPGRLLEGFQRF